MRTGKTFGSGTQTTINPAKIGAGATSLYDTMYRPLYWIGDEMDERVQVQNDYSLVTLMDTLPPPATYTMTNPSAHWRIENRLHLFSYITVAMSASDTYINIDEPKLAHVGYRLDLPETSQTLLVTGVDEDYSESWTNDASDACNVRVNRTKVSAHSIAASINSEVRVALPLMGELGVPKEGISEIPGDPMYNFGMMSGLYVKMSKLQRNALMSGDYGTHEKLIKDNELFLATMAQQSMLGSVRKAVNDDDEGMVYQGNGLLAQCHSNVINLGNYGNAATYQVVSEIWDQTCESANSSASKHHVAGDRHYMHLLNAARQEARLTEETHYNPAIGVDEFTCATAGGKTIRVQRHSQAMNGIYTNYGLTLDMGQLARGQLAGYEGWKWALDIDSDSLQGLTLGTDAIIGSQMLAVLDPDCFAVFKGGTTPIVKNRNRVGGIVDDISLL